MMKEVWTAEINFVEKKENSAFHETHIGTHLAGIYSSRETAMKATEKWLNNNTENNFELKKLFVDKGVIYMTPMKNNQYLWIEISNWKQKEIDADFPDTF